MVLYELMHTGSVFAVRQVPSALRLNRTKFDLCISPHAVKNVCLSAKGLSQLDISLSPMYLIVLSVGVFTSTVSGPHTLPSTEDVAGVTHTRLHTGTTAARGGGGLPSTRILTGVCTRLIVAVSGTVQSCREDREERVCV